MGARVCLGVQGPELAIHHSDAVLGDMNDWSQDQHGRSGLTARCRASTTSLQVLPAHGPPEAAQSCSCPAGAVGSVSPAPPHSDSARPHLTTT